MAAIVFTASARKLIEQTVVDENELGFVMVWSGGTDIIRGPNGEVVLKSIDEAGWQAVFVPWGGDDPRLDEQLCRIEQDGTTIFVDRRTKDALGLLRIDAVGNILSVEHSAA